MEMEHSAQGGWCATVSYLKICCNWVVAFELGVGAGARQERWVASDASGKSV